MRPSGKQAQGWRRAVFYGWIGLTIVFAAYLAIAAPFAGYFHEGMVLVATVIPPLMIVLLGIGIAWLVSVDLAGDRDSERDPR